MKKAVIDTNVLISALLKQGSVPDLVLDDVKCGKLVPVVNPYLRNEYEKVLFRDKFHFDTARVSGLLEIIDRAACVCRERRNGRKLNDPKDQEIYELYLAAKELYGAILITGNMKHYPEEEGIVSPRGYLEEKGEF